MENIIKWALAALVAIITLTLAVRMIIFFFTNIGLVAAIVVIIAVFYYWEDVVEFIDNFVSNL